jgi:hypothetical protein
MQASHQKIVPLIVERVPLLEGFNLTRGKPDGTLVKNVAPKVGEREIRLYRPGKSPERLGDRQHGLGLLAAGSGMNF